MSKNKRTCWHTVIRAGQQDGAPAFFCVGCRTILDDKARADRHWTYNETTDAWTSSRRPSDLEPNKYGRTKREYIHFVEGMREFDESLPAFEDWGWTNVDSNGDSEFKWVKKDWPRIFELEDIHYAEDFNIDQNRTRWVEVRGRQLELAFRRINKQV